MDPGNRKICTICVLASKQPILTTVTSMQDYRELCQITSLVPVVFPSPVLSWCSFIGLLSAKPVLNYAIHSMKANLLVLLLPFGVAKLEWLQPRQNEQWMVGLRDERMRNYPEKFLGERRVISDGCDMQGTLGSHRTRLTESISSCKIRQSAPSARLTRTNSD